MKTRRVVILANGDFPKKGGAAWRLLAAAKRVVCCDGAVDGYRRHFGKWPAAVVGDFDSFASVASQTGERENNRTIDFVRFTDQDTNDLEKAIVFCAMRGWRNPVIVGAMGKREDHAIGNVFRALDYGCEMVTDEGRFVPVCGKVSFKVEKGAAVSIFAPNPKTRMTSTGLEWPLDEVKFKNLYCATLNRATGVRVTLTATRPVAVFVAFARERRL